MSTNKERIKELIKQLEQGVGSLQEEIQPLGLGFGDLMQRLEDSLRDIADAVLTPRPPPVSESLERGNTSQNFHEETDQVQPATVSSRLELDFPRYSGEDDPFEWGLKMEDIFEIVRIPEEKKVEIASTHLESEANQWWQRMKREDRPVTWDEFMKALWGRFAPLEEWEFTKGLVEFMQDSTLHDYQKVFERLSDLGWTEKVLIEAFMSGLKSEITDGMQMLRPQTLKEAFGLARMKDEQLSHNCGLKSENCQGSLV